MLFRQRIILFISISMVEDESLVDNGEQSLAMSATKQTDGT